MRVRLWMVPVWSRAALVGAFVAGGVAAFVGLPGFGPWLVSGFLGVVAGVIAGGASVPGPRRQSAEIDAVIGPWPAPIRKAILKAAYIGPPPADPNARAAAARLVAWRLGQTERLRTWNRTNTPSGRS